MTQSIADVTGELRGIAGLNESDRYRLLSVERRRTTLEVLAERALPIDLGELARAVAEREAGPVPPGDPAVEDVRIALHHNHLPKMAALDVVEYDPETERIA